MEFIDVGANDLLALPERDIEPTLVRAAQQGVKAIVIIGGTVEGSRAALRIATNEKYLQCGVELYCTAGVHPCEVSTWNNRTEAELRACLEHPKCVAVGECGFDFYQRGRKKPPVREVQHWVLRRQLRIAADVGKPVYLHDRGDGASAALLAALRDFPEIRPARCLVHCVTSAQVLPVYTAMGMSISLSGYITYHEKGMPVRHMLDSIGPSALRLTMLETDAPFHCPANAPPEALEHLPQKPVPVETDGVVPAQQGRILPDSESSLVPFVARKLADVFRMPVADVARMTTANAERFFELPSVRNVVAAGVHAVDPEPAPHEAEAPHGPANGAAVQERWEEADAPTQTTGSDSPHHAQEANGVEPALPQVHECVAGDAHVANGNGHAAGDADSPPPLDAPRFVVSVNLTKLCKLLRGIGVDTMQVQHSEAAMVRLAAKEGRVVVARHAKRVEKLVEKHPQRDKVRWIQLPSDNATEQVKYIIEKFNIPPLKNEVFKRCVACNSCDWIKEHRDNCVGEVEENVAGAHEYFWRCGGCRKLFWEGGIYRRAKMHYSTLWEGDAAAALAADVAPSDPPPAPCGNGNGTGSAMSAPPPDTAQGIEPLVSSADMEEDNWDAAALHARGSVNGANGFPRKSRGRVGKCAANGTAAAGEAHEQHGAAQAKPAKSGSYVDDKLWKKEVHVIPLHMRYGVCLLEHGQEWELLSSRVLRVGEDPKRRPQVPWETRERQAVRRVVHDEFGVDMQDADIFVARAAETGQTVEVGRRTYYMAVLRDHHSVVRGTDGARPPITGEPYWLQSNRQFRFAPDKQQACQLIKFRRRPGGKVDVIGAAALRLVSEKGYLRRPPETHSRVAASAATFLTSQRGEGDAAAEEVPLESPQGGKHCRRRERYDARCERPPKYGRKRSAAPPQPQGGAEDTEDAPVQYNNTPAPVPEGFAYSYTADLWRFVAAMGAPPAPAPQDAPGAPPPKAPCDSAEVRPRQGRREHPRRQRDNPVPAPPPTAEEIEARAAIPATYYYEYADMAMRFGAQDGVNESIAGLAALMPKLREKGVPSPDFRRASWEWKPKWMQGNRCPEPVPQRLPLPRPLSVSPAGQSVERAIRRYFDVASKQDNLMIERIEGVRAAIERAVMSSPLAPRVMGVYVFGSAASGVALHESLADVDVCVRLRDPSLRYVSSLDRSAEPEVVDPAPVDDDSDDDESNSPAVLQRTSRTRHDRGAEAEALLLLCDAISRDRLVSVAEHVFAARVPVVRGTFDPSDRLPIDITVRFLGSVNTQLFRQYFAANAFLRPLSIVVKRWSAWAAVRSSEKGWLTAYCVQLMLLYALVRSGAIESIDLDEHQPVSATLKEASQPYYKTFAAYQGQIAGERSLTENLATFLRFYAWDFDWERDVVCLRKAARAVQKARMPGPHWDSPVAVRDPFEPNLNLTKRMTKKVFTEIRRKFRLSYQSLADGSFTAFLA